MLRRFGSRLTYANVVSTLGLFLVLTGGTAMAVDGSLPGQDTVGSEDIINNDILSRDIANGKIFNVDLADNLITGAKMKDGTLTGADIEPLSLTGANLATDAIPANGSLGDGSTKIATDAIRSSEIHQAAVASNEVRNNSLTGEDIDGMTTSGIVGVGADQSAPLISGPGGLELSGDCFTDVMFPYGTKGAVQLSGPTGLFFSYDRIEAGQTPEAAAAIDSDGQAGLGATATAMSIDFHAMTPSGDSLSGSVVIRADSGGLNSCTFFASAFDS